MDIITKLKRPVHFNVTLSCHKQLRELPLPDSMSDYGLVGLHPCGDLGPLLLRHFVECSHVRFICMVGCCFMKLTCSGNNRSYPISDYVTTLDSELSYVSREIACHAIEVYSERLRKGDYENLKVHAYRAALERILVECDPKLKHAPVRSIKHLDNMSFERYCELAVQKLNMTHQLSPERLSRGRDDLDKWRQVVIVYTLRLTLAPLVETVLLLDRVLYVLEKGLSCSIQAVFDPKLSPRNHIIVARRQNYN